MQGKIERELVYQSCTDMIGSEVICQIVIQLYMERKTGRDIASAAHVSFSEIGRIMKKLSDSISNESDINLRNKSKLTQAIYMF